MLPKNAIPEICLDWIGQSIKQASVTWHMHIHLPRRRQEILFAAGMLHFLSNLREVATKGLWPSKDTRDQVTDSSGIICVYTPNNLVEKIDYFNSIVSFVQD